MSIEDELYRYLAIYKDLVVNGYECHYINDVTKLHKCSSCDFQDRFRNDYCKCATKILMLNAMYGVK